MAALLIVVIHNSATWQYGGAMAADGWIISAETLHKFFAYTLGGVAVPFFFFISGVVMFRNYKPSDYKRKMKSRFKSLVVPYLIWNIVGMGLAIVYTYTPLREVVVGREEFVPTFENILKGIFLYKYNYSFWFMLYLIIFSGFAPAINLFITKKWGGVLLVVLLILSTLVSDWGVNLVFYVVGCFVGKHYLGLVTRRQPKSIIITCGVVTSIALGIRILSDLSLIELPLLFATINLLVLMMGLYGLADGVLPRVKNRKIYSEFFPVYVLHPYIVAVIVKTFFMLGPKVTWMAAVTEVLGTVITIVATLAIVRFWHNKSPRSYNLVF